MVHILVVANTQQPTMCRIAQPPPAYHQGGGEYCAMPYPSCSEADVARNTGAIPTSAVEQL